MCTSPIISAASKGSEEMINLILENKNINIHMVNEHGVNAFWVAAFYGHGTIMTILAKKGINTLS